MEMPLFFMWEQKERRLNLGKREYCSTLFFHPPTLHRFGLIESVSRLLMKGGLSEFMDLTMLTFLALVREFLAALDYHSDLEIRFQLRGREFVVTKDLIAKALGVTKMSADAWGFELVAPHPHDTWKEATGRSYEYALERSSRGLQLS